MEAQKVVRIVAVLVAGAVAVCHAYRTVWDEPATTTGYGPDVLHLHGVHNVEFGDTEQELVRRGVLDPRQDLGCGPSLTNPTTVSAVFADRRLVLLWASPPVRTPEGITTGTPIDRVRAAYPEASTLTAPPGTHRYDGLLARRGDRAYLFLHDGHTVRKTVAGYADYVRRLFDEGFGTC
ncbi:hypothetical protein [Micromonospora sp. HM5-17]|jgi:hypothetical protein|uniref:hypothetical protein n=1 Tax=Micromonospora sp. HM5-17 TaxID=2487710 RepID=UPI000F470BC8|nr:hypothetical protein [Micromonospora sp. HM5-17]ROT27976.1 hypothetical protein EF879_22305 [Micromonospora sp. HM5-17]